MFTFMNTLWKENEHKYKDKAVSCLIYKCIPVVIMKQNSGAFVQFVDVIASVVDVLDGGVSIVVVLLLLLV